MTMDVVIRVYGWRVLQGLVAATSDGMARIPPCFSRVPEGMAEGLVFLLKGFEVFFRESASSWTTDGEVRVEDFRGCAGERGGA